MSKQHKNKYNEKIAIKTVHLNKCMLLLNLKKGIVIIKLSFIT